MVLSTILVPRADFTLPKAKNWIKAHGYKTTKTDITTNYYRFRQNPPSPNGIYYSKKLPNGIVLVLYE
jgi:hypothetical protein